MTTRKRDGLRDRKDPRQNYAENSLARQHQHTQTNWRERSNISSFYFTRFSEEANEKDLWAHFRKWGQVREIFISKHRNKGGRRYGFVRFSGVKDVRRLERQFDNLVIGGMKLYVNIPKFERGRGTSSNTRSAPKTWRDGRYQGNHENKASRQHLLQPRAPSISYRKALLKTATGQSRGPHIARYSPGGSQTLIHLDIPAETKRWFSDAWVGHVKNLKTLHEAEEDIAWELGQEVAPKYIGEDMFLLLGLPDTRAEEMSTEEARHGSTPFYTLEKWNSSMKTGQQLVWVQCWGIPMIAWDTVHIKKIVAVIGEPVGR